MISIGKLIFKQLSEKAGLVGNNVFPIIAPEGTNAPFIVFERDSYSASYTKDGNTDNEPVVSIYIITTDYTMGIDMAEIVRELFEFKKFNYSGIIVQGCTLEDVYETFNGAEYIQKLTFKFNTN